MQAWMFAAAAFLGGTGPLRAHHDPAVNIEALTEQIGKQPGIPELYFQRADEYMAQRKYPEAEADLRKALELKPDYLPAKRTMARIFKSVGRGAEALDLLRAATQNVPLEHQFLLTSCRQLEGEILLELGRPRDALAAVEAALNGNTAPDVELLLMRAEAQRQCGLVEPRIAGLKDAWDKCRAVLLRNAWLDALIDAGRGAEAAPYVQTELESSRFLSTWLIKRARIFLAAGNADGAKSDLEAAVGELTQRLQVDPPPFILLCDRAAAYAMLGKFSEAAADAKRAEELGAGPNQLRLAQRLLSEAKSKQPAPPNAVPPAKSP
jgi:tetratricopeptide (TPR) repeat protein